MHQLASMLTPVYKLLRMVDSFTPAVGKVYYKAMKIDNDMKAIADKKVRTHGKLTCIVHG